MDFADKIAEHAFGDFKIADDAVFHGTDSSDGAGCFTQHFLGNQTNGFSVVENDVSAFANGNHGRLVENYPLAADTNQGVAGAQVYSHILAEPAQYCIQYHFDSLRYITITVLSCKILPFTKRALRDRTPILRSSHLLPENRNLSCRYSIFRTNLFGNFKKTNGKKLYRALTTVNNESHP